MRTDFPRAGLTNDIPSVLEPWAHFGRTIDAEVWAKRDDAFPIGLGGNKVRKADLILASALRDGVDTLITTGAVQSNHCRVTAAAAARLGLAAVVVLRGSKPDKVEGSLLADYLFGAQVVFTDDSMDHEKANQMMDDIASSIRKNGGVPRVIPLGGSNALGAVAFFFAAQEFARQCDERGLRPSAVYLPVSSGASCAGLALGMSRWMPATAVVGVAVSDRAERTAAAVAGLIDEAATILGIDAHTDQIRLRITDEYLGSGYAIATAGTKAAIQHLAGTEGVLVDVTYTGKALDGLISAVSARQFEGPIVFWHTGGCPELFSRVDDAL